MKLGLVNPTHKSPRLITLCNSALPLALIVESIFWPIGTSLLARFGMNFKYTLVQRL